MRYHDWIVKDTDAWSDLVNSFIPMVQRYEDSSSWRAGLTVQSGNIYRVLRWRQNSGRTAYRTPDQIRKTPSDEHYWLVLPQNGVYAAQHGDELTVAKPGFASIMALDEPCLLRMPPSDVYALALPRAEVDQHVRPTQRLRAVLDLQSGLGRIVQKLLHNLHDEKDQLSDREFNAVCDRLNELVCMLTVGDVTPTRDQLADVAAIVRQHVRQRIGPEQVHLIEVARALNWSPRQLKLALHSTGTTFRRLRQEEALREARDMLQNPLHRHTEISEIAARTGFSPVWFSTA
ncbi:MAG: helix-turn-helix domain-containing protein, partial [Corynebacteriales bacterium]|nr:helix-turn-helix domain-containing protein [Mycobacteriales bacterium]